jgi:hypothetical protein
VKRGGPLSFLVGTIGNVLVMEIGWTDVGSGGNTTTIVITHICVVFSRKKNSASLPNFYLDFFGRKSV